MAEILRVVGLLGEKFTFFNSLGTTKISGNLKRSVYVNIVLLKTFQNNFNYASTSNIREVIKFYNLGDNFWNKLQSGGFLSGCGQFSHI